MLDQTLAFKHRHLRELGSDLDAHQVPANGLTVALLAASPLDELCICTHDGLRCTLTRGLPGTIALAASTALLALTALI